MAKNRPFCGSKKGPQNRQKGRFLGVSKSPGSGAIFGPKMAKNGQKKAVFFSTTPGLFSKNEKIPIKPPGSKIFRHRFPT
jgi:hypothetical protein